MIDAMVAVLNQIRRRLFYRSRAKLERRYKDIKPGRVQDASSRTFDRVARHLKLALRANRPAGGREQQSQVIVDLGDGAYRRARVLDGVLLAQRQGWRNIRD